MQLYAPDIHKPGRKEEEKDGGRKMEGWKEGGREGRKKRKEKKEGKEFFFLFLVNQAEKLRSLKVMKLALFLYQ